MGASRQRGDAGGGVSRPQELAQDHGGWARCWPRRSLGLVAARSGRCGRGRDPSAGLYPVKRNPRYTLDRPITDPKYSENYNNFYEFGSEKAIADDAQALKIRPWTVKIDGMVEKPIEIGIDDLLKKMPLEERLYRHRCVEAWSMAVPWSGFADGRLRRFRQAAGLGQICADGNFSRPRRGARPKAVLVSRGPMSKGVTMAEANNELAFLVTGMYGKPVPKQDGAPLRLALPWKYGFKSAKSIVRVSFTDKQPVSFWETVQGDEYGFWANVNPEVPHPRWSQATERVLGTDERVPTLKWNGYGEYVAHLYDGLQDQKLFF